ncbi:MAG: OmpA family protein [Phormidesmis sp.]
MTHEPDWNDANTERNNPPSSVPSSVNRRSRSLYPRPNLNRGFDSYAQPQGYGRSVSDTAYSEAAAPEEFPPEVSSSEISSPHRAASRTEHQAQPIARPKRSRFAWICLPWQKKPKPLTSSQSQPPLGETLSREPLSREPSSREPLSSEPLTYRPDQPEQPSTSSTANFTTSGSQWPYGEATSTPYADTSPIPHSPISQPPIPQPLAHTPRFWQRQPYVAIAYLLLCSGALTLAWIFGILVAQVFSGNISSPPLQERLLRKSSRLGNRLWHFPELWHTPTVQSRIEAIPLPETGPVLAPLTLSPIEKQPLVDELNSIETELLTLDRRLQTLEKKLGKSPYQGTDIDTRINALRAAIDPPPVQPDAAPNYEPVAIPPEAQLLEVAQLKITLPSDALFSPGQSDLKADSLLNQVLDQLVNYPEATISIRSYSDNQTDTGTSREHTLAQANALATYLRKSLPNTHRWVTVGMGQTQPVIDNTDPIARQRNRRIEILVDTR